MHQVVGDLLKVAPLLLLWNQPLAQRCRAELLQC